MQESRTAPEGSVLLGPSGGLPYWRTSLSAQWINLVFRMKVVSLALFYLGSVSFFGLQAAKLDFQRKWSRWALSRAKRDAALAVKAEANAPSPLVHAQEVKGEASRHQEGHIRMKRQDPNAIFHTHLRVTCKMGTCSVAKLADQLFHLNNKEKDANAPSRKISPHGYGRRRRSLMDTLVALASSSRSRILSRRRAPSSLLSPP